MRKKLSRWVGLVLFPVVFLYDEICFKLFGGIGPGNILVLLLLSFAAGGIFQMIYLLLPGRKIRFYYTVSILFLTAVVFVTECFVGRAFQTFMTFDSLLTGAGDVAGDFGSVVTQTITRGWYVIFIFLLPVIFVCLFKNKLIFNKKPQIRMTVLMLFVMLFVFIGGNFLAGFSPVYREEYQFDLCIRTFGLMTTLRLETANAITGGKNNGEFTTVDLKKQNETKKNAAGSETGASGEETSAGQDETKTTEQVPETPVYGVNEMNIDFQSMAASEKDDAIKNLDLFLASQKGSSQNEYTGLFKGKNLIMICAEAFSPYAVSEEMTPALYRLIHNGFYFSDYYQPAWGGSTSTGEYSFLMGLIPTEGVKSIRKTEGHNLYLSMGNQLSRLGYYSAAYHNNSHTYYGRNKTHPNFGYDTFIGMGNGMEQGVTKCWPESDKEMMDFTVPQYIGKEPFSIYYMTVSGHCGYSTSSNSMSNKNWDVVKGMDASNAVKAYQASQMELEYAMESLLSQLEKAGIADNTVICMTSDHYPYGLEAGETWGNDRNYLPELYGCKESEFDKFVQDRNALILWSGSLETDQKNMVKEIKEPVYSLDILPTLSNLFGVEFDSRLFAGRDVFSDEAPLVIWPDYSWKTDQAYYNAVNNKLILTGEKEISGEYKKTVAAIVKNKLNLSKITLSSDYWNRIFAK